MMMNIVGIVKKLAGFIDGIYGTMDSININCNGRL